MGMPITVEIVDNKAHKKDLEDIFDYFTDIDAVFSTYKKNSEISRINRMELREKDYSADMKQIFALAEKTKKETQGYFDMVQSNGLKDPSGVVKGWAVLQASKQLQKKGFSNFYIDAGGDAQVSGKNKNGEVWRVGIRNPFNRKEVVKVIELDNKGIATSGTAIRGQHIYNPHQLGDPLTEIVSMSVIGPDVCEADRFATAAFAMQKEGIVFIENLSGFEGYMIDNKGVATYTSGFERYTIQ